jgi:hypothetical protein
MHIELLIGGTTMKFLKSTRSKVFAAVAAVMALSASAAYSFDCNSYCNAQATTAAQNAKQQMLSQYYGYCMAQPYGQQQCWASVQNASNDVYNNVYNQTMQQCMGQCHP